MINKVLNILKESKDYISGEDMAQNLSLSRTAVWKYINKLKKNGYDIVSVTGKGYKLIENDILNENEITYPHIYFKEEMTSTNNVAKELASKGAQEGLVVVCDKQSEGKGRLGRSWEGDNGKTLCFSVLLRPKLPPHKVSKITIMAGIAVLEALREITGCPLFIKWPNDIVYEGKKVCGILTEMSAEVDNTEYVVLGVGINVNTDIFPKNIKEIATSLYILTGEKYKRANVLDTALKYIKKYYDIFIDSELKNLKEVYNSYCINKDKAVETMGKSTIYGIALGINEEGSLEIKTEDGKIVTVMSGEVSLRGDGTY
ncbi:MAG: biotin--[Firmicutes bacterium]|nr:biotin--[acetyl-CoA-carboxylase] ligase [Bacillota bacterium]